MSNEKIRYRSRDYFTKQERTRQYSEYLQSEYWKEARNKRLKIDGYRCQMCGSKDDLEVHHLSYHYVFKENGLNDRGQSVIDTELVTLCHDCHGKITRMMNRITNSETGKCGWKDEAFVPDINEYKLNRKTEKSSTNDVIHTIKRSDKEL